MGVTEISTLVGVLVIIFGVVAIKLGDFLFDRHVEKIGLRTTDTVSASSSDPTRPPRRGAELNRTHPLSRGLVTYNLYHEAPMRPSILCYDRQLSDAEVKMLTRYPYAMFSHPVPVPIAEIAAVDNDVVIREKHNDMESKKESYNLLGRKLRMRANV